MADNFLFYKSWLEIIQKQYSDDLQKQKDLVFEIVKYGISGEMNLCGEDMFMLQCQVQINSAKEKHEKRVEAGRRGGQKSKGGGAPVGNKNAAKSKTTSKQQANDNVNVNDNDNDNNIINNLSIVNNNIASPFSLNGKGSQLSLEELARLSNMEE